MIRPTEIFENINWSDDFIVKTPTISDAQNIGKLFLEGYSGGIDYELFGQQSLEEAVMDDKRILNICVTIGNPSEGLYHNMGFFSGVKFTNMYLNN